MKENKVTKEIDAILAEHKVGLTYYRPVPGVHGKKHLDYIGCCWGLYFVIEAKRQGKDVEPHQADTIREVLEAGGVAFVIAGNKSDYQALVRWLNYAKAQWTNIRWRPPVVLPKPKVLETPI